MTASRLAGTFTLNTWPAVALVKEALGGVWPTARVARWSTSPAGHQQGHPVHGRYAAQPGRPQRADPHHGRRRRAAGGSVNAVCPGLTRTTSPPRPLWEADAAWRHGRPMVLGRLTTPTTWPPPPLPAVRRRPADHRRGDRRGRWQPSDRRGMVPLQRAAGAAPSHEPRSAGTTSAAGVELVPGRPPRMPGGSMTTSTRRPPPPPRHRPAARQDRQDRRPVPSGRPREPRWPRRCGRSGAGVRPGPSRAARATLGGSARPGRARRRRGRRPPPRPAGRPATCPPAAGPHRPGRPGGRPRPTRRRSTMAIGLAPGEGGVAGGAGQAVQAAVEPTWGSALPKAAAAANSGAPRPPRSRSAAPLPPPPGPPTGSRAASHAVSSATDGVGRGGEQDGAGGRPPGVARRRREPGQLEGFGSAGEAAVVLAGHDPVKAPGQRPGRLVAQLVDRPGRPELVVGVKPERIEPGAKGVRARPTGGSGVGEGHRRLDQDRRPDPQ